MGEVMESTMGFMTQPWFIIVLIIVSGGVIFLIQFFGRRKYERELDEEFEEEFGKCTTNHERCETMIIAEDIMIKYDWKKLIMGFVVLGLYIIGVILMFTLKDDAIVYVAIALVVITIVNAIIVKDQILKIIWKVPTWKLFMAANAAEDSVTTGYSGTIDSNGNVTVTRDRPILLTIICFFLAIFLFSIKIVVLLVYLICTMVANFLLCSIAYPLFYGLKIKKNKKIRNFYVDLQNSLVGDKLPAEYADIFK